MAGEEGIDEAADAVERAGESLPSEGEAFVGDISGSSDGLEDAMAVPLAPTAPIIESIGTRELALCPPVSPSLRIVSTGEAEFEDSFDERVETETGATAGGLHDFHIERLSLGPPECAEAGSCNVDAASIGDGIADEAEFGVSTVCSPYCCCNGCRT